MTLYYATIFFIKTKFFLNQAIYNDFANFITY